MAHDKYHAELNFKYGSTPVRFTAGDLDGLLKRFNAEVLKERERTRAARDYTWIEPNLTVEVCHSWSEFNKYDHAF